MSQLTHSYRPRGACRDLFSCRAGEVVLTGPAGTGKSRACLEKIHMTALLVPGVQALIVRKTRESLGASALQTWRKFVVPEALQAGIVAFYGGSAEEPPQYRYANGSSVKLGGMDKPTKIMSTEYDMIYVQEAIELTVADWESLGTRLGRAGVLSYSQLLADTNPDRPTHFLKQRMDRGDTVALESRHSDNPTLFGDDGRPTERGAAYLARLDKMTGVRRMRLRDGLWVSAEGMIYSAWDDARNLVDRFDVPPDWQRYWAIDFGFTNPFVLQWWAEAPDGELVMYREIYTTGRTVEEHVKEAMSIVAPGGSWIEPRPVAVICDHDAGDRATFTRHSGLRTVPAKKVVSAGIEAVMSRISSGRLKIMRGALVKKDDELDKAGKPTSTLEEIPGYVWADNVPLKRDDHGCDAMRYIVANADLRKRPNIRWM